MNQTCYLSPPEREMWLQQIQANGNLPEDWLLFTDLMRRSVRFKDDTLGFSLLSGLYAKALKVGHSHYLLMGHVLCEVQICGLIILDLLGDPFITMVNQIMLLLIAQTISLEFFS